MYFEDDIQRLVIINVVQIVLLITNKNLVQNAQVLSTNSSDILQSVQI